MDAKLAKVTKIGETETSKNRARVAFFSWEKPGALKIPNFPKWKNTP